MSLKICRGCLIESNDLKNIFSLKIEIDYIHNLNFSDCFKICTDILIEKSDKLPQKMCDMCIESLVAAYKYRTQCKKSDLKLRSKITKNVITVKEEESFLSDNEVDVHFIDSTSDVFIPPVEEIYEEENVMTVEKLNEVEEDFYEEELDESLLPESDTFIQGPVPESIINTDNEQPIKIEITSDSRHRQIHSCTICRKYILENKTKRT